MPLSKHLSFEHACTLLFIAKSLFRLSSHDQDNLYNQENGNMLTVTFI